MADGTLKPYPFCGGEVDFIAETATIKCKHCGGAFIVTSPLISRMEAAEAWNRRANDVAEVVHCKDCKWWTKQSDSEQGRCALSGHYPTGCWYCANGERREP